MFNPDLEIKTKLSNITKAFFDSESTIDKIEANDQDDRILKKSISISVETYLENPRFLYTSTGKIEKLNYQLGLTETLEVTPEAEVSHDMECLCDNCILPIYLITGSVDSLPVDCDPIDDIDSI